ncbi:AraC family transcriptional regulator [uncultured Desulfobacter sp.]|uniref:AraC family transcriptional regulator n=1 Tax=uncultured Desulfobacter sp. TaxID=240139 RepID=UPI002AA692C0|nr:AraC family transcriptional regulator [uncultured Desulfobacter sp.]
MNDARENKKGKSKRQEYISRINRVIDYIDTNTDKDFSLKTLAEVACFSQFHFHRIFRAMSGETLHQFIQRLRIEKAAALLIHWPEKSITDIALDCGFSGSAAFARAFKAKFQMSASQWRLKNCLQNSNIWKDFHISSYYIDSVTNNLIWRIQMKEKNTLKSKLKTCRNFMLPMFVT